MTTTKIAVLGGGAWGLALARLLSENGHSVAVWEFNPIYAELLQTTRCNQALLKDFVLPAEILISNSFADVLTPDTEYIILAVPSQFLRGAIQSAVSYLAKLTSLKAVINVAKGIEEHSLMRMSEILQAELPSSTHTRICCLSGPSHAEEVARHIPTAVVIAAASAAPFIPTQTVISAQAGIQPTAPDALLQDLQNLFSNQYFRVYSSPDLIGMEIGGAVKNIISIAAGIIDGLGFGDNTKGALLIRGIVEIKRLGVALGAHPETFMGLSGMGDLITTAISPHSRNRFVGFEIGSGKKLADILAGMKAVAEGVATARSVHALAQLRQIEMPITEQIYSVLFEDKSPLIAITELMTRNLRSE